MKTIDLQGDSRRASRLMKALGNPHRLIILRQLAGGEKSVGRLETLVGIGQSSVSQHLARLRRDDIVTTRRQGQTIYYSLQGSEAKRLLALLDELYRLPAAGPKVGHPAE